MNANPPISAEIEQKIRRLGSTARKTIEKFADASGGNIVTKSDLYYAKGRFQFTVTTDGGAPPTKTLKVASGTKVSLFDQGRGNAATTAGFPAAFGNLTDAETNLIHGSETNGAELMVIDGIGFMPCPSAEPWAMKFLLESVYASCGVNGDTNTYKLGSPLLWPGGGGLYGGAESALLPTDVSNFAPQKSIGFVSNGLPGVDDYRRLPDPIVWGPKGTGDSTFVLQCIAQRDVTLPTFIDRVAVAAAAATPNGTSAFTVPAAASTVWGTNVDFYVILYGVQFAPRSQNR